MAIGHDHRRVRRQGPLLFLFRPFGGQAFLGRNLVFLATYEAFGANPVPFMWTVLLTHLLNVALLFAVVRGLTHSVWLACLGAALWGTSPLAVGTLDWYAAFGHVLVGTLLLVVLRGVVRVEIRQSYALRDAARAHRDLEARKTTGSTVLIP